MSRSKRRPRKRMPGDGCFLCDMRQRYAARERSKRHTATREQREAVRDHATCKTPVDM